MPQGHCYAAGLMLHVSQWWIGKLLSNMLRCFPQESDSRAGLILALEASKAAHTC